MERRAAPQRGSDDVLVRPRTVGICGTDFHIYEGKHPYLQYPRVMGHELAVEVIEAPPGSGFAAGEVCVVNPYLSCGHCVACRAGKPNCCVNISVLGVHQDGGMVGLMSVPQASLVRGEGLTLEQCATVEFLAIGAHAVRRGAVRGGDRVLVVGAGPIGLGVALFARLSGGHVSVIDRDRERAAAAKAIAGVDDVFAADSAPTVIKAITDGEGFDLVFDATGNAQAMEAGFDFVAHGGRYVLVSVVTDAIRFSDPSFHAKEITLMGSRNATSEDFARVIAAMRGGQVPVDRLITRRTTLDGAVSAIPQWATEKSGLLKAIVEL
jgi:2-desacetyl-2-hydroxyethyl bacteriochlorophyllide A dehydrogenase